MTKGLKRKLLAVCISLLTLFSAFAFGVIQPKAADSTGKQLAYAFDSGLFINQVETSTAKLSCQDGYMFIDTTSTYEDGFQFSVDAPQDIERINMSDYNYVKFKFKRNDACLNGRFQLYFWKSNPDNAFSSSVTYRSEFSLGEEYNDTWVEVILDLRNTEKNGKGVFVKNMETGEVTEQGFSAFQAGSAFEGGLYSMRLNFARGNKSPEKEAWVEYMAFFETLSDAENFDGLAKSRLTNAEETLTNDLTPSEFALSERTEEKIVKLATDYTEGLLGISTEVVNYSYQYPTKTEYGYIEFDARLCSGGYYHFVEDIRLEIEPEPNQPVLYKFDNEEIINRLLSQGKMSVEAYYLDGVMKIVQADPYVDDGFWVLIDTVADNNRFLMQSYPIIQYRINITGQGPSQLFFANYASYYSYNIGYDEGDWLRVTFDTSKTENAIEVVNEDQGTVQYLDSVNSFYSTDFTPPAFRGLSDEFRFNFGRRSGLERWALVDYIGFFPTLDAAREYAENDSNALDELKQTLSKSIALDYADGATKANAENAVKLTVENLLGDSFTVTVKSNAYNAPILNQTKGALTGSVIVSDGTTTESLPFRATIGNVLGNKQKALCFGSAKVLDWLTAGAGTSLTYNTGLVLSGETRSVASKTLSAKDKINLGAYKYAKIGFVDTYSGTVGLELIANDGTLHTYEANVSADSATVVLDGAVGILDSFALTLSGAGETTVAYLAFFENETSAELFECDISGITLGDLKLSKILASNCYNEREANREALKAVEKELPKGYVAEILPLELVKPTRNAEGYFRFKVSLTSESVFGAFGSESAEYVLPIAKIIYYETEEFYFNGEAYAVSENAIDNADIVTVEITIAPSCEKDGFVIGNETFGVYVENDEIVVRAGQTQLISTSLLNLSARGKTRLAIVFETSRTALFVDGTLFATGEAIAARTGDSVIYVGGTETQEPFDGEIGEIKIWDTVRTSAEISRYVFEKLQGTEDGLVAYWRTENDCCGFGNRVDGENPLAYVDTYTNYYHEFTGYDYLKSEKSTAYAPKTVELWVKASSANEGRKTLITNNTNYSAFDNGSFGLYTTATGGLMLRYGAQTLEIGELSLYNGRWNHVAFTFGDTDTAFYLNGALYKTFNAVCNGTLSAATYYLGSDLSEADTDGYGGGKFVGEMANVRFWSTIRTADEISSNKQILFAKGTQNLLWNLTLNVSKNLVFEDNVSGNSAKIVSRSWYKIINEDTCDYWTAVILPDPQDYAVASSTRQGRDWLSYDEWRFYNFNIMINDWILDNRAKENIELVLTVGDLTQNATPTEWEVFQEHMSILDGVVPYTLVLGNHDLQSSFGYGSDTRSSAEFNKVFRYDEWKEKDCYGGSFEKGNLDNTYFLFDVQGEKYMVICLEFEPRDEVLEWFDYIVKKHADYKVIVSTHENLIPEGELSSGIPNYGLAAKDGATTNNGTGIWNKLAKDNPNVVQVVSGHVGGGLTYLEMEGENNNTVQHITTDTWSTAIGGNPKVEGLVTLCRYYEDGRVDVRLYDPTCNSYYISGMIYEEDMSEERGL